MTQASSSPHASRDFFAGAGAGMVGIFVGYPLDTVKVHQQVGGTKPMTTISLVLKTYGIKGFYRGLLVPMVTNGVRMSLLFGTYTTALGWIVPKDRLGQTDLNGSPKTLGEVCTYKESFAAGMVAGLTASFLASPIELVKVQMQIDGGKTMTNPITCIQRILKAKGPLGLFTGLSATLSRNVHAGGFYLMTYKILSDLARNDARSKGRKGADPLHLFVAGGISGLVFWLVNMPMDRIKSQIQASGMTSNAKTKGIVETAKKIYGMDGLRGFYKGVSVVIIRAPPVSGAIFLSLEYLRKVWDFVAEKIEI